jgi:arylsulfatase A-like enzyme
VPALAFTLLLTGDSVIFARLQPARPQNVLLIAIDTLRLDRTSLTGAEVPGEFTPHLGAWAAGATVFSNAVSQAPWTLPAFASIFTGMYPRQHGAIEFGRSLRARETSLAEVLREAGYRTGAVVSNFGLRRDMGLAQGFELYDTSQIGDAEAITSGGVTQQALEFLARDDGRPFFLFAHYMDPHATYRDHAEYTEADAYRGWLRDESHHVMDLRAVSDRMGPAERDFVRHLYDEEVEYADAEIGRLLAYLRESGRDRDTVVVFVSDHGEEFLERGWIGHSRHVHDEVIRVPFAMDLPALPDAPRVVTTQVETRAIAATLLDYLGIEHELPVHAPSLLPLLQGASEAWGPRDAFSEIWLKKPAEGTTIERDRTSCLRTERWKLILTHETGALQLFDLEADPGETRDVAAEHPEVLTELEGRLRAWLAEQPGSVGGGSVALDEATQRELRALGYLGGDDAH